MKKIILFGALISSVSLQAQTTASNGILQSPSGKDLLLNTETSGATRMSLLKTNGFVGINQLNPVYNLQIHGTSDYIDDGSQTSIDQGPGGGIKGETPIQPKSGINYGKTARIGLTNTITSNGVNDGTVLQMSENNFYLLNREAGNMSFGIPGLNFLLDYNTHRSWLGLSASSSADYGRMNIQGSDNGLYLRTTSSGKFGLSIRSASLTDNAIQVMGTDGATRNFSVLANGQVYARKYTTTLSNIPDYVFDPSYQLMSFEDLRLYLLANRHLPNVPSASEYTEQGVDLGEMNRVLLEKTEELTLYILQLEERVKQLEAAQAAESTGNSGN